MKQHIITKKVAKHGSQAVIVIPRIIENDLKPGTIVRLTIDILEEVTDAHSPPKEKSDLLLSSSEVNNDK